MQRRKYYSHTKSIADNNKSKTLNRHIQHGRTKQSVKHTHTHTHTHTPARAYVMCMRVHLFFEAGRNSRSTVLNVYLDLTDLCKPV